VTDKGFKIKSMIVDGVPVSITQSVYTFEQIEKDHTFNVTFTQIKSSPSRCLKHTMVLFTMNFIWA